MKRFHWLKCSAFRDAYRLCSFILTKATRLFIVEVIRDIIRPVSDTGYSSSTQQFLKARSSDRVRNYSFVAYTIDYRGA